MDLRLLEERLADLGEPRFRAGQVWEWAARGAAGYTQMTNLPAPLRARLSEELPFSTLEAVSERRASDGTLKTLFQTADGRALEAVAMRYKDGRRSICVSSQSGCPLTCAFCATGQMRFARNLTAAEILDQALHFRRIGPVDHAVFMGMGEPMLNLDAVLEACERLPDLGVTHRRTTISTVGWVPGIERLAECAMPLRLAVSLHAPEDELRSQLMPVNERYPLARVIEACQAFYARRRRRVFVEYVMLAGVNDRHEQALALADLLSGPAAGTTTTAQSVRGARTSTVASRSAVASRTAKGRSIFKVNLIPYNPTDSPFAGSSPASIGAFRAVLEQRGLACTVRLTRGREIEAACGQLASYGSPSVRGGRSTAPTPAR